MKRTVDFKGTESMKPTCWSPDQGVADFSDAEVGQEFVDFEGLFSEGGGGIGLAQLSEPSDVDIMHVGEALGSGVGVDQAGVFVERDVFLPMRRDLDCPVAAPPLSQLSGIGLRTGTARHGVIDRDCPLTTPDSCVRRARA